MSLRFLSFYLNSVHLISSHLLWLPFTSYVIFSCVPFDSFISVLLSFHAPHFFSFHFIPFGFIEFHACLRSCHIISSCSLNAYHFFLNQVDSDGITGLPPIQPVPIYETPAPPNSGIICVSCCTMAGCGNARSCENSMLDMSTGAAPKRAMVELSHGSSMVLAVACFGKSTRCCCWRPAFFYQDSHTSKASRRQLRRNPHESIAVRNRKRFQSKRGRSNREHDGPRSLLRKQPANFKENYPLTMAGTAALIILHIFHVKLDSNNISLHDRKPSHTSEPPRIRESDK